MNPEHRYREIPYNYTSLSDREIILRYFDEETLGLIDRLRAQRITGRSARLVAEVIGDVFMIERNPYVLEDFLEDPGKLRQLRRIHDHRIGTVAAAAVDNPEAIDLVARVRKMDRAFFDRVDGFRRIRKRMLFAFMGTTAQKNVRIDPFTRVAHSTDATDWRIEHPMAVLFPEAAEELPRIIAAARKLGLSIIPRGGGTGLTAGAVPVTRNTIVVNSEKLNRVLGLGVSNVGGRDIPVVSVEAGCVTDDVIEYCRARGYIFATDPTSAWASTIGGNIAENAGGKKCVLWGTAIDNLVSWQIVTASGETIEVRRRDHPYRKILPEDCVVFDVFRIAPGPELPLRTIELLGTEIRKRGLGKDITNKALKGLPGVQKEGGDGFITAAQFVLYRPFAHCRTLCLEFFGRTMVNASQAILGIRQAFDGSGPAFLTALEHFDSRYVRAISYRNKSARTEVPQAVLLIDVESDDLAALDAAASRIAAIARLFDTEAVVARDENERTAFWKDRKNLGAIARHTNAFKLNEDVVIPLESLPAFADFIERLNLDRDFANLGDVAGRLATHLGEVRPPDDHDTFQTRLEHSRMDLETVRARLAQYRAGLDLPAASALETPPEASSGLTLFECFRDGVVRFSLEDDVLSPLRAQFHGYEELSADISRIAAQERGRAIIIATHMHAGDGNVHVNIPVHSGDPAMMLEADETAATVMREAVRQGGVVSGEHGIGLTKLKFVDGDVLDAYGAYKKLHDPDGLFNPGKLERNFPHHLTYTPSFSLLELEAYILEATDLEKLSGQIASCVRCGKCKQVCCTQIPQEGMLYNPRNKILAVGQITEAVLYHAQTMDMRSFKHFGKLKDISDHCTACHKCLAPCPVKIDFGKVTLAMRELQARRTRPRRSLALRLALYYLWRKGYAANAALRMFVFRPAYALQRVGHRVHRALPLSTLAPRLGSLLDGRISARGRPSIRERLGLRGRDSLYSISNTAIPVRTNVVYFPGCGSERLYPEISMAALALLHRSGVRTFLPPTFTCCGYPFQAAGQSERAALRSFENRVVFHRMADSIGSSEIDAVLVSCGTCLEMLEQYDLGRVFRNAPLLDINEFLVRKTLVRRSRPSGGAFEGEILYHEPCHTPLKSVGYNETVEALLGVSPTLVPECCGDAGTLALSRPDISCVLRRRKAHGLKPPSGAGTAEILTTCPSCVAGLSKLRKGRQISGKSLIVRVAEETLGREWQQSFLLTIRKGGVQRIPL